MLDEVDAPLDETNVGRLAEMIKGMSGETQFLLVTHSKRMMTAADFIYGVTMQEPGVSKLVSVRLGGEDSSPTAHGHARRNAPRHRLTPSTAFRNCRKSQLCQGIPSAQGTGFSPSMAP